MVKSGGLLLLGCLLSLAGCDNSAIIVSIKGDQASPPLLAEQVDQLKVTVQAGGEQVFAKSFKPTTASGIFAESLTLRPGSAASGKITITTTARFKTKTIGSGQVASEFVENTVVKAQLPLLWLADACIDNDNDGYGQGPGCLDSDCDDSSADLNRDDVDGDSFSSCDGDCDDQIAEVYPQAREACNGRDDDCDRTTDEVEDLTAPPCGLLGVCALANKTCQGIAGWVDCELTEIASYQAEESLCDGLDNDCDGATDEDCQCGPVGITRDCPGSAIGECEPGEQWCEQSGASGAWSECVGQVLAQPELCNLADDDCDGVDDNGFDTSSDAENCGECGFVCQYPNGQIECQSSTCVAVGCEQGFHDINSIYSDGCEYACTPTDPPLEVCDLLDNDCDGFANNGLAPPPCALTRGVCSLVQSQCVDGQWADCVYPSFYEADEETRCDGLDNDCDGLIDEELECTPCSAASPCPTSQCATVNCVNQRCLYEEVEAGSACEDGNNCTLGDYCVGLGQCVAGDASPCTTQCLTTCSHTGNSYLCTSDPTTTPCDDGVFCNVDDHCDGRGACVGDASQTPCTQDCRRICDEVTDSCYNDFYGTTCSTNGVYCDGAEICDGLGRCFSPGDPCTSGDPCNRTCNELEQNCHSVADTPCEDGDPCTYNDGCNGAGVCTQGTFEPDHDGDGWDSSNCGGTDCDDHNVQIHPGRPEILCPITDNCSDGVDNDCDDDFDGDDADCHSYICLTGPASATINHNDEIRVQLAIGSGASPAAQHLVCYTDDSRLLDPDVLFFADFESGGVAGMQTTGDVDRNFSQALFGVADTEMCGNATIAIPIDSSDRESIQLSYAASASHLDANQYLIVEYDIDNSNSWHGLDIQGDQFLVQQQHLHHILPASCNNNPDLRVRFRTSADSGNCAYVDEIVISDLPDVSSSRTLLSNDFEASSGNSLVAGMTSCSDETIVLFDRQGANDSDICLARTAAYSGTQGARIHHNRPSYLRMSATDLSPLIPVNSQIVASFAMREDGLSSRGYGLALYSLDGGSTVFRASAVGLDTATAYQYFEAVLFEKAPPPGALSSFSFSFRIPDQASVSDSEGIFVDDFSLAWRRSSTETFVPFVYDEVEQTMLGAVLSTVPGTARITCAYYGVYPPLFTDGDGVTTVNSAPLEIVYE